MATVERTVRKSGRFRISRRSIEAGRDIGAHRMKETRLKAVAQLATSSSAASGGRWATATATSGNNRSRTTFVS